MQRIVCGMDVSSDKLDSCILLADDSARPIERSFRNSRKGVRGLIAWLKGKRVELAELWEPRKVELELQELIKRRQELQDMIGAEKNRLRLSEGEKEKSLKRVLKLLEKELEGIERRIEELSRTDRGLLQRIEVLREQKGIGFITAVSMLSCLPELGKVDRKQIGALAGVSPFNRESGKWKGKSFISGGRKLIRKILYMPALVAIRFNQKLREFYQRLLNSGKPKKSSVGSSPV